MAASCQAERGSPPGGQTGAVAKAGVPILHMSAASIHGSTARRGSRRRITRHSVDFTVIIKQGEAIFRPGRGFRSPCGFHRRKSN